MCAWARKKGAKISTWDHQTSIWLGFSKEYANVSYDKKHKYVKHYCLLDKDDLLPEKLIPLRH